jgi:hypothetical protein
VPRGPMQSRIAASTTRRSFNLRLLHLGKGVARRRSTAVAPDREQTAPAVSQTVAFATKSNSLGISPIVAYCAPPSQEVAMIREPRECLKRADECARLAEAESDPELRAYLIKLGSSWTQAAREMDEGKLQDA